MKSGAGSITIILNLGDHMAKIVDRDKMLTETKQSLDKIIQGFPQLHKKVEELTADVYEIQSTLDDLRESMDNLNLLEVLDDQSDETRRKIFLKLFQDPTMFDVMRDSMNKSTKKGGGSTHKKK